MNTKKISIMLGGVFPEELPLSDLWCGVDRGALYLLDKGINPLLSCGDFDSINYEQRKEKSYLVGSYHLLCYGAPFCDAFIGFSYHFQGLRGC